MFVDVDGQIDCDLPLLFAAVHHVSILFDCDYDASDGWMLLVHLNRHQTMNCYRRLAILRAHTCSDNISLSMNYQRMHKILVHYLKHLKTTLSRWIKYR